MEDNNKLIGIVRQIRALKRERDTYTERLQQVIEEYDAITEDASDIDGQIVDLMKELFDQTTEDDEK